MEIKSTNSLPFYSSDYKKGEFKLIGRSIDELVNDYYCIILEDIRGYTINPVNTKFIVDMDYYNTRSSIYLKDIFNLLSQIKNNGHIVQVDWYYYKDDYDMAEAGHDYEELTGLKFNLIKKDKFDNII